MQSLDQQTSSVTNFALVITSLLLSVDHFAVSVKIKKLRTRKGPGVIMNDENSKRSGVLGVKGTPSENDTGPGFRRYNRQTEQVAVPL